MASKRQIFGYSIIPGIILLIVGTLFYLSYPSPIPPSRGDGDFRDISWRFPPGYLIGVPVPGYMVSFPAFDLDEEYQHEFVIEDLPDLRREVGVYLFVSDSEHPQLDDKKGELQAKFEFEVINAKGQVIAQVEKPLSELTWSTPSHIKGYENGHALYSFEGSFFQVLKNERYTLRVSYQPDPTLHAHQGFVYLRCGGSI